MSLDTRPCRDFKTVAEIGSLGALISRAGGARDIYVTLPASEEDWFRLLVEAHNDSVVQNADTGRLLAKLREVAAKHYRRRDDGAYEVVGMADRPNSESFGSFKTAFEYAQNTDKDLNGIPTLLQFMIDPEAAEQALDVADAFIKERGYKDISYIGFGSFVVAFRATDSKTGRSHVIRFSGPAAKIWSEGYDVPENLKPVELSPGNMPEGWSTCIFPEVLSLERVASAFKQTTIVHVTYKTPENENAGGEPFALLGDLDLIEQMFINSISPGYYAGDTVRTNIALLPDGNLVAYDMGTIFLINEQDDVIIPFDPKEEAARCRKFGILGEPFKHIEKGGVPKNLVFFQPESAQEYNLHPPSRSGGIQPAAFS